MNLPLFAWFSLVCVYILIWCYDHLEALEYQDRYLRVLIGALFLLVKIFLIVKIFKLDSSVPYKNYLTWFALFNIIELVSLLSSPFVTLYLVEIPVEDIEIGMRVNEIIMTIIHQFPYVAVIMLSINYLHKSRIKEQLVDNL